MVEQRSPKPRAEGSSPSAPAKNKVSLLRYLVFCCVKGLCSPRHAERAGHRRRSAAGGGYSEAVMAQRSKLLAAPRQKQFWAPQEGLRSKFKSFCPCQKQGIAFAIPCFLLCKRVVLSEARGACRASPPKRRRRRIQRGGDGAAVKIACRSKAKAILGTARGLAKQVQVLEAPAI